MTQPPEKKKARRRNSDEAKKKASKKKASSKKGQGAKTGAKARWSGKKKKTERLRQEASAKAERKERKEARRSEHGSEGQRGEGQRGEERRDNGPEGRRDRSAQQRGGRRRTGDARPFDGPPRQHPPRPEGPRRALTNQGGAVSAHGDKELSALFRRALERSSEDLDTLTHGFHTYPARMHPGIAEEILAGTGKGSVLDPFCGSGTVLIEAQAAGRECTGTDLNPLAVRLARVKTRAPQQQLRHDFEDTLRAIAEASEERVRNRTEVRADLHPSVAQRWQGHILKELAGLREEIAGAPEEHRLSLEMVFSAIVVKFSNQKADTSGEMVKRRLRKGLPTEFFLRKGLELAERWQALGDLRPPRAAVHHGDIRRLPEVVPGPFDLILTSPPYGGTYDYVDHHALRYPWLGIDSRRMQRDEIGARRHLKGSDALARWDEEFLAALRSMATVLSDGGLIVLLQGDAQVRGRRIDAEEQVARLASQAGLRLVAAASQPRPDYTGGPARREHLLGLQHR